MALERRLRTTDPTHRLVVRSRPGVDDADADGLFGVENCVVDVATEYGTAVHLCVESDVATDSLRAVRERIDRVRGSERALANGVPEYRATLPEDAPAVRRALSVADAGTDGWLDRLHGVAELAVLTTDSWLYRSVPHETHVREINAGAAEGYLDAVRETLRAVPRAGVLPVGALAEWQAGEWRYELTGEALRRSRDGERWQAFDLDSLRRVAVEAERSELVFDWEPRSPVGRAVAGVRAVAPGAGRSRPNRVRVPGDAFGDALDWLGTLRDRLDYEYEIAE